MWKCNSELSLFLHFQKSYSKLKVKKEFLFEVKLAHFNNLQKMISTISESKENLFYFTFYEKKSYLLKVLLVFKMNLSRSNLTFHVYGSHKIKKCENVLRVYYLYFYTFGKVSLENVFQY